MQVFALVSFTDEKDVLAVVPQSWCRDDKCYWPPYKTHERITKAVKLVEFPLVETWTLHPMQVLKLKGE